MLELGIAQAQTQFTQLLNQSVLIIDKKARNKKAVILPYDEYLKLVSKASCTSINTEESEFSNFVGVLDNTFETKDEKYNEILK